MGSADVLDFARLLRAHCRREPGRPAIAGRFFAYRELPGHQGCPVRGPCRGTQPAWGDEQETQAVDARPVEARWSCLKAIGDESKDLDDRNLADRGPGAPAWLCRVARRLPFAAGTGRGVLDDTLRPTKRAWQRDWLAWRGSTARRATA